MKKLEFVLFVIADFILFVIGKKIFDTQYLQFFILAILLIGLNLFHVWFQIHSKKKRKLESEEKSMLHNVTVRKAENKKLEEFWIMRAVHEIRECDSETKRQKINFHIVEDAELDHEPTPQEIAQFLSDSKADFASVVQNYRFESELPF